MGKSILHTTILLLFLISSHIAAQQSITFDFKTKDYKGEVKSIEERLDHNKNYLIVFSAFWCNPCVQTVDNVLSKNIEKYRELYNLEVILLMDYLYDNTTRGMQLMKEHQWHFDLFFTDDIFQSEGVTAIPRYYFVPAGEVIGNRVSSYSFINSVEEYYLELNLQTALDVNFNQVTLDNDCNTSYHTHNGIVNHYFNFEYNKINDHFYRKGLLNDNIYRFNYTVEDEILVYDFTLDICDTHLLVDSDGDTMTVEVVAVEEYLGKPLIITDAILPNDCGDTESLHFSPFYGSNAGFEFDVENGELVSRLVCSGYEEIYHYENENLINYCVNSSDTPIIVDWSLERNFGNGKININGDNTKGIQIHVIDNLGRLTHQFDYLKSLDISSAPSGVYYISISNKTTCQTFTYFKI